MHRKIKEWLKRYLPAEIIGTITAVGVASITHLFSANYIFIAYAATLGEAIGFYSTVIIQNIVHINRNKIVKNESFKFSDFSKIIANIVLEFGPSGILDGLLLRPFFMYLFPVLLKNFTLGIFVGKFTGDLTFYMLVILSYEMKKRYKKI
jgi:hypothetical protein